MQKYEQVWKKRKIEIWNRGQYLRLRIIFKHTHENGLKLAEIIYNTGMIIKEQKYRESKND